MYTNGQETGISTGGNSQTYCLQAGTKFFPKTQSPIVFIEQAEDGDPLEFSRELAQILQIHTDIKALVIGRFPTVNEIYDLDFGHTQPIFTVPLGQNIMVTASSSDKIKVNVQEI